MAWDDIPDWVFNATKSLLNALKERDPYTYGHCRRVARNARLLAEAAGLNDFESRVIEISSLFHDLGKLGIPDLILLKPGRLTAKEESVMRNHPIKSAEIIQPFAHVPFFRQAIPGIRSHHERIDGAGYPDNLKGGEIPLSARIILIADTYDAMTSTRPYRRGLSSEMAYKELKLFANRQFDPHLVKIFLKAHPHWDPYEDDITEEFVATNFKRAA